VTSGIVAISVAGAGDELRQLAAWLRDEDELRGRVRLAEVSPRAGIDDSVVVAVTSGSAETFCTSLFAWLGGREEAEKVSLRIKRSGNTDELELDCGTAADAQDVLTAVQNFLDADN